MSISKRYQRIANRLRVFDLVGTHDSSDDALIPSGKKAAASTRFVDFYSYDGIVQALDAYGVHDYLCKLGLGDYEILISRDDGNRHRLQLVLDGIVDDDHRIVDFIVRPVCVRAATVTEGRQMDGTYDLLMVEWLCLQNPRADFTNDRPRLPGQRFPGLGLGYAAHNMTLIMAQRLCQHGVLNVPEHYHLAVIYDRAGYDFVSRQHEREVDAVVQGTQNLHMACAAWAVDRELVYFGGDDAEQPKRPWSYTPAEMLAAASEPFSVILGTLKERVRRFRQRSSAPAVSVDLDELRQSFLDDPVEGIDPDRI